MYVFVCMYVCMCVYELIKVSLNRLNLQDNEAKSNLSPFSSHVAVR